jgi:hypothetical protein
MPFVPPDGILLVSPGGMSFGLPDGIPFGPAGGDRCGRSARGGTRRPFGSR